MKELYNIAMGFSVAASDSAQPAGHPISDLPAHIHIAMLKDEQYVPGVPGELLIDDDKRLTFDRRNRALADGFLILKNSGTASAPVYLYNIKLK